MNHEGLFQRSQKHLESTDVVEMWYPDVLGYRDYLANPRAFTDLAIGRYLGSSEFDEPTTVWIPKKHFMLRRGLLLSAPDRLAYHAAALQVRPKIQRRLGAAVYSGRTSSDPDSMFEDPIVAWLDWQSTARASIDSRDSVLFLDVSTYFDSIRHEVLDQRLDEVGTTDMARRGTLALIRAFSGREFGIPQGPDASRLYGNLYLSHLDKMFRRRKVQYYRYMDDVIVVARSRRRLVELLHEAQDALAEIGLSASSEKTELIDDADEAKSKLQNESLASLNTRFFRWHRRDDKMAELLYSTLRDSIAPDGSVEGRPARSVLRKLPQLPSALVDKLIVENLEYLAPLSDFVAVYLVRRVDRPAVRDGLSQFLSDRERNLSDYLSAWLLAAVADSPSAISAELTRHARKVTRSSQESVPHRSLAMSALAKSGKAADRALLKDLLLGTEDPAIARGALAGLARCEALEPGKIPARIRKLGHETSFAVDYLRLAAPGNIVPEKR